MGNGPMPVDLNPREVAALREAGLDTTALLRALAPSIRSTPAPSCCCSPRDPGVRRPPRRPPLTPADLKV
ncbi:hypothetical protein G4G29_16490 [Microbacterium sp. Se63.02b]|nr:hypothetical protein G4G29_16490 [Microbacterium sp. Se63.02b]